MQDAQVKKSLKKYDGVSMEKKVREKVLMHFETIFCPKSAAYFIGKNHEA